MVDPVIASDGVTYEYQSLVRHAAVAIDAANLKSPMTRKILKTTVYENLVLREEIYDFVEKHGGKLHTPEISGPILLSKGTLSAWRSTGSSSNREYLIESAVSERTLSAYGRTEQYWAYCVQSAKERFSALDTFLYIQRIYPWCEEEPVKIPMNGSGNTAWNDRKTRIISIQWDKKRLRLYVAVQSDKIEIGGIYIYSHKGDMMAHYPMTNVKTISCLNETRPHVSERKFLVQTRFPVYNGTEEQTIGTKMTTLTWVPKSDVPFYQSSIDGDVIPSVVFDDDIDTIDVIDSTLICLSDRGQIITYELASNGNVLRNTRKSFSELNQDTSFSIIREITATDRTIARLQIPKPVNNFSQVQEIVLSQLDGTEFFRLDMTKYVEAVAVSNYAKLPYISIRRAANGLFSIAFTMDGSLWGMTIQL
jgi:hypothetical protein